jgi:hypothetical protein
MSVDRENLWVSEWSPRGGIRSVPAAEMMRQNLDAIAHGGAPAWYVVGVHGSLEEAVAFQRLVKQRLRVVSVAAAKGGAG